MRHLFRQLTALLPLVAMACTSLDSSPPPTIEGTSFATSLGVDLAASTKTASGVYYRDLAVGSGAAVANGQRLSVRYTGWLADGTQFDSNVNKAAFTFTLGAGEVIDGWDLGIPGMKVGGQRQLIIPSSLGYGPGGSPPEIPSNAILVFNVNVLSAQ